MSDVTPPTKARKRKHTLYAALRARRWTRIVVAFALGATGLVISLAGKGSIAAVTGAALLALGVVVALSDGSGRSVLLRRPGRPRETSTPDALLWLWCFAALATALLAWKAMDLGAAWIKAGPGRQSQVVITASAPGPRIQAASQPAP